MLKDIILKKVNQGEFEGTIYSNMLPLVLQEKLDVLNDEQDLQVYGGFSVDFDDDMVMVSLSSIMISTGNRDIDVDIDELDGNEVFDLEDKLSSKGQEQDWYFDKLTGDADSYRDEMSDHEMESYGE